MDTHQGRIPKITEDRKEEDTSWHEETKTLRVQEPTEFPIEGQWASG